MAYKGKYPTRIKMVSGVLRSIALGAMHVQTNDGKDFIILARDTGGAMPACGADIAEYVAHDFTAFMEERRAAIVAMLEEKAECDATGTASPEYTLATLAKPALMADMRGTLEILNASLERRGIAPVAIPANCPAPMAVSSGALGKLLTKFRGFPAPSVRARIVLHIIKHPMSVCMCTPQECEFMRVHGLN